MKVNKTIKQPTHGPCPVIQSLAFEVMTLLVETHFLRQVLQCSPLLLEFLGSHKGTGDIWRYNL